MNAFASSERKGIHGGFSIFPQDVEYNVKENGMRRVLALETIIHRFSAVFSIKRFRGGQPVQSGARDTVYPYKTTGRGTGCGYGAA